MEVHGYTEGGSIDATIDGQRMTIPDDPANRHRQKIAEWEAKGNVIPAYTTSVATQITSAPDDLFGGPTLEDVFNGN